MTLNEQCRKQKDNIRSPSPSQEMTAIPDVFNSSFILETIEDDFIEDILETIGTDLEISDSREDNVQLENNLANVSTSTFDIPALLCKYEIDYIRKKSLTLFNNNNILILFLF